MNKMERFVASALFIFAALWAAAPSGAQSPFDGTWKINMAAAKFSPKPIVFYLSQGWYHCVSCNPTYDVQADGHEHPVSGQSFDGISVKELDPKTVSVTTTKNGKVLTEQTRTVSADGKTLDAKITVHPLNSDQPITAEATYKLIGTAPSGVQATSGSWQILKVKESDNGTTTTYKTNGDEFTMSTPAGESYTAKFDGNDYPSKGTANYDTVSLKKIDPHTIEETDKRAGNVVEVSKITVAGNTMTVVSTNKLTDRTSTFTATKK